MYYHRTIEVGEDVKSDVCHPYSFEVFYTDDPVGLKVDAPFRIVPASYHSWYRDLRRYDGFDDETISMLYCAARIWDGQPMYGTPAQMNAVACWMEQDRGKRSKYDVGSIDYLKSVGLYVDDGHIYGASEVRFDPPEDLVQWLFSLPGKGDTLKDVAGFEFQDDGSFFNVLSDF